MESILSSIKQMLGGIEEDDTSFDQELVLHINGVLSILTQNGVGPENGFRINDKTEEWTDFIGDSEYLNFVKSYVHLKVKLVFDPPTNSALVKAIETQADELLWRINVAVENSKK